MAKPSRRPNVFDATCIGHVAILSPDLFRSRLLVHSSLAAPVLVR
jgi:hypothetical protein